MTHLSSSLFTKDAPVWPLLKETIKELLSLVFGNWNCSDYGSHTDTQTGSCLSVRKLHQKHGLLKRTFTQ